MTCYRCARSTMFSLSFEIIKDLKNPAPGVSLQNLSLWSHNIPCLKTNVTKINHLKHFIFTTEKMKAVRGSRWYTKDWLVLIYYRALCDSPYYCTNNSTMQSCWNTRVVWGMINLKMIFHYNNLNQVLLALPWQWVWFLQAYTKAWNQNDNTLSIITCC